MADQTNERGRGKTAGRALSQMVERLAPLRAAGWRALERDGAVVTVIRRVNDALGRPLAPAAELDDRRAFARGYRAEGTTPPAPAAAAAKPAGPSVAEPAPVLVYFMDKQRRDAARLSEILDGHNVPYKMASLEDDPAAQAAVRRDSKGFRLPLVFIAGECVGGREQLLNLGNTGALKKLVFGA